MEAPPRSDAPANAARARPRTKGWVVVAGLFAAMALTALGALAVRAKYGPAQACDYGTNDPGAKTCAEHTICAISVGGQGRCLPLARQAEPMAPPFPPGHAFLCRQGPLAAKDKSHAWGTDVYAVDLMPSPEEKEAVVVAPADGEAHVYDRCEERDPSPNAMNSTNCGAGYGNHVRIWDGTDLVLVGHLARVTVKDGAPVKRGDPIGIAGVSGSAGARHVHLVVTRLRPGDHIGTILGSPGHKGGVAVVGALRAKKAPAGPVTTATFDELGCGETSETAWVAP